MFENTELEVDSLRWLDDGHLLGGVRFSESALVQLGARLSPWSPIPSVIDLSTGTVQPIERYFTPSDDAPAGRNTIEAVWQD